VVAVNRAATTGQRAVMDSGRDIDGADRATAAAGARSTDTGFKFYDAGNAERGLFTYEAATDGRLSMGTNTTAAATRRVDLAYGRNAADVLDATQGGITTRDNLNNIRSREAYGASNNGTAAPTAGEYRLNDAARTRVRLDYGNDQAGTNVATAGNFGMIDNGNRNRVRADYGMIRNGTSSAAAGNLALADDAANVRIRADYGQLNNGTAGVGAGNFALSDNGARERIRADYGQDIAGGVLDTAGKLQLRDNNAVGPRNRIAAYYGIDAAGAAAAGAGVLSMRDNVGAAGNERFRSTFNGGQGDVISRDSGNALRYEQEYVDNNSGRVALRDRNRQGVDQERFIAAYNAADGNITMRDAASQNRFRTEFAGSNGTTSTADNAGRLRFEQTYTNATSTEIVRSQTNTIRRQFDTNSNVFDLRGANGTERVIINSNNGNFTFANADANSAAASNGFLSLNAGDGGLEIASGNDDQSFIDFRGNGNLAADFRGRVLYDDGTDSMRIATAGSATGEVGIQNGSLAIAGDGAEGGQLILSNNNTLPTGEGAATWSMDVATNNLRLFRGTGGAATMAMTAYSNGNVDLASGTARFNPTAHGGDGYLKLGTDGVAGNSPLGANMSVLDVDDIFLRGRNIWLSETNLPNSLTVVGIDVVSMNASGQRAVSGTLATNCPGTIYYVAMPAWWLSPTMMTAAEVVTGNGGAVIASTDRNPQSGGALGGATPNAYDNNTEMRIYMSGTTVTMESRQRNHATWRAINGGVAVVTGYCDA
jgi:hypothetical protein